ncbi:hypothetical protein C8R44DRAFT_919739 [Mycena epipterygia]|nr:hypothetical protein C8R44DRAFT_919739 [Mycena epipterygia]
MALFLTLFTHLCVHLLGLMSNPVLTFVFSIIALLTYGLYLALLPAVWPGRILHDTLTRIEAMKTCLHDEAARRRTLEMYNLSTYGLRGLEEFKRIRDILVDDHYAHLAAPLSYARVGLSLCKRARRCKRHVEVLCQELDLTIQRFDNQDTSGDEGGTASRGRAWSNITTQRRQKEAMGALTKMPNRRRAFHHRPREDRCHAVGKRRSRLTTASRTRPLGEGVPGAAQHTEAAKEAVEVTEGGVDGVAGGVERGKGKSVLTRIPHQTMHCSPVRRARDG